MVEPGRPADETAAETAAREVGKTTAVPNSTPTDAVELAWSNNRDEVQPEGVPHEPAATGQSWRATWRIAGLLVVAGLLLAGAIVVGRWVLATTPSPATTPPTPSASAAPSTTAAAPSSIASTPDQDDAYIKALNAKGISFANPGAAIYNGKTVCQNIGQGMTVQEVVAAFRASSPAFSDNANDFVAISVRAYCPQHNNLVAGF